MKTSPPNEVSMIRAPKRNANQLRNRGLITKDLLQEVKMHNSVSRLHLSVNDSAGNKTFDECYEKEELLGEGGFADVFRCRHKARGTTYAVKEIHNGNYENYGENIKDEIKTMKRLRDGCNIIQLLDVFRQPDRTFLIMEEMEGGDLLERLYDKISFTEQDGRRIARKLIEAVRYCHKKNVAHRDIKPENVLLTSQSNNSDIRLADFGCAKYMDKPNCLMTLCGSAQYCAPELYTHTNGYSEKCDNWSIGVVIFILLGGYAPFDEEDDKVEPLVCEGKFKFHKCYWEHVSEACKNVIRGFITVDAKKRMTLEQALDSKWLRRRDMESLSLDGSCSTFDAWVRKQNESNSSFSLEGTSSRTTRTAYKFDTASVCEEIGEHKDEVDEDDGASTCSLSLGDL
ncbi:unnamed protein product [Cylindrotheca closterium]|uniref:Protein kinase domain-containing protein n=1 Tax=Cylindrotheca closterium TaxID=2856 RepID=A0AAD2G3N6_9STRA|nr:unnamed protein product [Cylindrotheca closterium]